MTMAVLNILSQPTTPQLTTATSPCLYSCTYNFVLRCCNPFSFVSAPSSSTALQRTSSKSSLFSLDSQMLRRSPKSGNGGSWMQDNSSPESFSDNGRRQSQLYSVFPRNPANVSSVQDLFGFICSGPLLDKLGLTPEMVAESVDRFEEGEDVTPLVIGFSAPQGCGKTTLVFALDYLFRVTGRKSATLSIDDFYLTAEDQAKLREQNPGNALLELRGNAGSHDLSLSVETLSALCKLTKEGMKMKLPRYDKSAHNGRGDRADPSTWPEIEGPLTVILFEGWMLGFKSLPVEVVKAVDPQLETVNKNLEAYYDAWDKFIESWIVIQIKDPNCVYEWRLQAEIAMRADGKPGMSDEEVMDFVSRYLPAYKAYLPTLYSEGPSGSDPERVLVVEIDEGRNPILAS